MNDSVIAIRFSGVGIGFFGLPSGLVCFSLEHRSLMKAVSSISNACAGERGTPPVERIVKDATDGDHRRLLRKYRGPHVTSGLMNDS